MSFTSGLLSVSKYLQPKSQIHVNVYLGLLSLAQISHSAGFINGKVLLDDFKCCEDIAFVRKEI